MLYHCMEFSFPFNTEFQKKPYAVFEIAEVVPVMTNNYEESILKGAKVKKKVSRFYHWTVSEFLNSKYNCII